jgi:glutamate racemase
MGKNVTLIDSAKQVAAEVKKILVSEGLVNTGRKGKNRFYVSDNPEWFSGLAKRFLGHLPQEVHKVNDV